MKRLELKIKALLTNKKLVLDEITAKYIKTYMIISHYIQSLSTYFENCLLQPFVSQGSVSRPSSQWPTQAALRDKFQTYVGKDYCIYK